MNKTQLEKILMESNMSPYGYSLNGQEKDEAYHLSKEGDKWLIFYMERGNRRVIGNYPTEKEACLAFHKLVKPYL